RKVRAKARKLAAHLLEVSEDDVNWELGRFFVRDAPQRGVTIQDCALAAYTNMPDGLEPGLENHAYYDPPNMTWPFAAYLAAVEIDPETGVWEVLRVVAPADGNVDGPGSRGREGEAPPQQHAVAGNPPLPGH